MPQDRYFLTGDAVFSTNWLITLTVPKSQGDWVSGVLYGYLELLSREWPWITGGESTPADAALIFQGILDSAEATLWQIGDIKWSAATIPGEQWLPCNNLLVSVSVAPDLFDVIGTEFSQPGDPPDTFRTPDLRSITPTNVFAYILAEI